MGKGIILWLVLFLPLGIWVFPNVWYFLITFIVVVVICYTLSSSDSKPKRAKKEQKSKRAYASEEDRRWFQREDAKYRRWIEKDKTRKRRRRLAKEKKRGELARCENESLSELIKSLGSLNNQNRIYAAKTLGERKDARKAVRPLIEALKDLDDEVAITAAESLGKIGDPRATEALCTLSSRIKKNRAAESLGNGDKKVLGAIEKLREIKFSRMAQVEEKNLKEMKWQDFEDTVAEALNAVPSDKRTSDMGIDGVTSSGVPIQIKQSEKVGRNVVDNFETALRRYYPANKKNKKGIIVAFSFTKGAYTEADRAKREDSIDIQLIEAEELV